MPALRIALAGAGWVSRFHLSGWRRTAGAEVVAVCDPDPKRAGALAQEFGIDKVFSDAATMLDLVRPDALDVAASLSAHQALCLLAADRGVHILCQKPLAASHAQARALVAAVGVRARLMVHENWRFRPQYRRMRAWLDAGHIGAPLACQVRLRASGLWPNASGVSAQVQRQRFFATEPRLLVGEVLLHHLDVVRWFLGDLSVLAARSARISPCVQGEDVASIMLAGGRRWASIDGNMVSPGAPSKAQDMFELMGSGGVAAYDGEVLRLRSTSAGDEDDVIDPQQAYADSYAGAIGHFAQALVADTPFESDPGDHLKVLAQVEAIYDTFAAGDPSHAR
ncbi:MAG: Gfo/Idh/MocA family oxidoreductase [Burkholderiaceae bacterium]